MIDASRADIAHPAVQGWWANLAEDVFLPNARAFAYLVAYGSWW